MQRVSAELMEWQLDSLIRSDRFSDYPFPLDQFTGANVGLVSLLTVNHPIASEADAENYVFSIREFHNTVLGTGTVPLELLERQVDGYMNAARR